MYIICSNPSRPVWPGRVASHGRRSPMGRPDGGGCSDGPGRDVGTRDGNADWAGNPAFMGGKGGSGWLSLVKVGPPLARFGPVWPSLAHFGPVWSPLAGLRRRAAVGAPLSVGGWRCRCRGRRRQDRPGKPAFRGRNRQKRRFNGTQQAATGSNGMERAATGPQQDATGCNRSPTGRIGTEPAGPYGCSGSLPLL
jgi:hypothetical protein